MHIILVPDSTIQLRKVVNLSGSVSEEVRSEDIRDVWIKKGMLSDEHGTASTIT